jgi:hypothetical protein
MFNPILIPSHKNISPGFPGSALEPEQFTLMKCRAADANTFGNDEVAGYR